MTELSVWIWFSFMKTLFKEDFVFLAVIYADEEPRCCDYKYIGHLSLERFLIVKASLLVHFE